jgi:hypothetical protein
MLTENNWLTYSFDDGPIYGKKLSAESEFKFHISNTVKLKNLSYADSLKNNATVMRDNFSEPFDVLLSGGIDSEVIVRTFHDLGIKQNVVTFRLENNYNIKDVEAAQDICQELNIPLKIIDWNLEHWINNNAYDAYQNSYCPMLEKMIRFGWLEYLDNIPVFGEGEPYWRIDDAGQWLFHWGEDDFIAGVNGRNMGRTVIGEWYAYTPEVCVEFSKLPLIQQLIANKIPGKVSSWSSRSAIHQAIWPSIKHRPKMVGYEGQLGAPATRPQFLTDFYNQVIQKTRCSIYKYTLDEMQGWFK